MVGSISLKVETIEWEDSQGHGNGVWLHKDDLTDLINTRVVSVGFIVKETKTYVRLIPHMAGLGTKEEQYSGHMDIPKRAIIKRTKLVKEKK